MSGGKGVRGNREVSPAVLLGARGDLSGAGAVAIPEEGSEPEASEAHETHTTSSAVTTALMVATGRRIFQPKRISWS
jgi:hypothetical protein